MSYNRRKFLKFLGKAKLGAILAPSFLYSCSNNSSPISSKTTTQEYLNNLKSLIIESLPASDKDDLQLANGLDYHTIIKWGNKISNEDSFGYNNDFTCGKTTVIGTHSNCSGGGGITLWTTFLSCEENYGSFYSETVYDNNYVPTHKAKQNGMGEILQLPSRALWLVSRARPKRWKCADTYCLRSLCS